MVSNESSFYEKVFTENLQDRKIIFNDEVTQNVVEDIVLQIFKYNKEDKDIPIEKRKPIFLYINSVGGEIGNGFVIIDAIEASKTPVYAVVLAYAYSMGGLLLLAAKKKYAFKNSTILLHDGSMGAVTSGGKFKDIAKFYDTMGERIKEYVLSNTKMTSEFYDIKYEKEFYMYADTEAKELGIVDYIIGVDCELDEIL